MIKCLKIELRRAFCSAGFILSVSAGTLISLWYFVQFTMPFIVNSNLIQTQIQNGYIPSVFNQWIGSGFGTIQQYIFFLLLPIFAALPAAASFNDDLSSGIIKNILVRCKRSHYYLSKLLAVMLSGGVSVTLPLVINLLLTCLVVPAILPIASTAMYPIFATSMWAELFYTFPWVYTLGYLVIIFLFSGLISQISLSLSFYFKNKVAILFSPFLIYMFSYTLFSMLGIPQLSPFCFLPPAQPTFLITFEGILIEGAILVICSLFFFLRKGIKEDVL